MKSVLIVANVAKEHILKFHIPTIQKFKDMGWRVDVACAGDEPVPYCDHQFHTSWHRSPFTLKTFKGINELKHILREHHYDLVFCHTPVGGLVSRLAAAHSRKHGTKVVYCAHGLHFFKGAPLINWLLFYPIEKYLARKTDVFFTVNREDYATVQKHFNKRMTLRLVPEVGVNLERLQLGDRQAIREQYRRDLNIPADAPVLIYVAELIKNKNQTMLVDMIKELRQSLDNVHLLLVGPEHDDGAVKRYIEEQNLQDCIHCLGWRSDIGMLMQCADLCTASSIREGFGINLLEALYCGVPVIATDNRGHQMVIDHGQTGFLVPVGDHVSMAKYAQTVLTDETLYQQFATVDVSRYDCRRVADELYNEIMDCIS